jgi:hypothetical protein
MSIRLPAVDLQRDFVHRSGMSRRDRPLIGTEWQDMRLGRGSRLRACGSGRIAANATTHHALAVRNVADTGGRAAPRARNVDTEASTGERARSKPPRCSAIRSSSQV